jgi:hypothetical protein
MKLEGLFHASTPPFSTPRVRVRERERKSNERFSASGIRGE